MRELLFRAAICFFTFHAFSQSPAGIRLVDYDGAFYPIYGLATSKNNSHLLVSAYGSRFYMLSIADKPLRGAFSQKETQIWSRILSADFKWGAKPVFSPKGKSVLLKPLYENPEVVKVKPTALILLDVLSGNTFYERSDVLSAAYLNDTTLLVTTEQGLEWIDLRTRSTLKKIAVPEAEAIAVSEDGQLLAMSFIPDEAQLVGLQAIDYRKGELKIAKRGKRLLAIYQLPDMKAVAMTDEELDVVFRIRFTSDNKSLLLFTRNFKSRSGTKKADLKQENISKLLSLNMIRIDAATGEIDKSFYYSTNYIHSDYNISPDGRLFAFSSTGMVSGSLYKTINGVEIYNFNVQDQLMYSLKTKFRWFKKIPNPYQFAFIPGQSKAYISSGADLAEWDYSLLPQHMFNAEGNGDEEISGKAIHQLDSLTTLPSFTKLLTKNKVDGMYVFDVTVFKKGEVATVFSQTDEGMNVLAHNVLVDYLRTLKFSDLNIPKDKRVKFRYTFNIETFTNSIPDKF